MCVLGFGSGSTFSTSDLVAGCGNAHTHDIFFKNITPLFAVGYISEVKLQVTITPHYN